MSQLNVIEKICITCPVGCHLKIEWSDDTTNGYKITGNQCKRGVLYAENEMRQPMRQATTTVRIHGGELERLPVKTSEAISKELVLQLCQLIETMALQAPIFLGETVISNVFNSGVDVVACRTIESKRSS